MREWKSWKPLHQALRQRGYRGEFHKISMRRWRNSASPLLSLALPNSHLQQLGLPDLEALPVSLFGAVPNCLRSLRSRMRKTHVRFSETPG